MNKPLAFHVGIGGSTETYDIRTIWVQRPSIRGDREIVVEARVQDDDSILWAVMMDDNFCLSKAGDWELRPVNSDRADGFFERCRWATCAEAYAVATAWVKEHPQL
jgi:hypothetical protein